jgi:hypothetical protein
LALKYELSAAFKSLKSKIQPSFCMMGITMWLMAGLVGEEVGGTEAGRAQQEATGAVQVGGFFPLIYLAENRKCCTCLSWARNVGVDYSKIKGR